MPSIIIGGENTNVGLRYMDELARQRELAMREASMRQSISMASSSRSGGGGGMDSGAGGARMVQAPETSPQPSQMGENGLPVDAEERTKFMRQMFAGQQNQAKAQQMQQLDSNAKQYDQHLSQFGQALQHAQTPEQVEQLMDSIRSVTQQKQDAVNQLRGLQATPNKTGNQQLDALAAILGNQARGKGQAQADVEAAPYEAMGKFYAGGVQDKLLEKKDAAAKVAKANADNKAIAVAQKQLGELDNQIKDRQDLMKSGGMSSEALAKLGRGEDLILARQQAQARLNDLIGQKETVDIGKDLQSGMDAALAKGEEVWNQRKFQLQDEQANREFNQKARNTQLRLQENAGITSKLEADRSIVVEYGKDIRKLSPEAVDNQVAVFAKQYKQRTGEDMPENMALAIKSHNPSWNEVTQLRENANSISGGDPLKILEYYKDQLAQLGAQVPVIGKDGRPVPSLADPSKPAMQSVAMARFREDGMNPAYVTGMLSEWIKKITKSIGIPNPAYAEFQKQRKIYDPKTLTPQVPIGEQYNEQRNKVGW